MNYRHSFHAGSFADVVKHAILCAIFSSLKQKDKPFCFIDAFAGLGMYDLTSNESHRSPEYLTGVALALQQQPIPASLKDYVNLINSCQTQPILHAYPGSPEIAKRLLRSEDDIILNELHDEDHQLLLARYSRDRQVHIHHRDAYELLPAILPPKIRRGLIFIDPPFESTNEFEKLTQLVASAYQRFPQGIYAVWYPIKTKQHEAFLRRAQKDYDKLLIAELTINDSLYGTHGLIGTGMLIINPPYQIETTIKTILHDCWQLFSKDQLGSYRAS
ncbi:MAG: 23S rRNA (adenine(2030)-N(6))-methyltransferase RlmJ [Pseudomonadota bacterium]|nr:23S rRNA (adenine(2030)-N(6))-methyltransferase RlmJ [Pseudomonadota bacterium]